MFFFWKRCYKTLGCYYQQGNNAVLNFSKNVQLSYKRDPFSTRSLNTSKILLEIYLSILYLSYNGHILHFATQVKNVRNFAICDLWSLAFTCQYRSVHDRDIFFYRNPIWREKVVPVWKQKHIPFSMKCRHLLLDPFYLE